MSPDGMTPELVGTPDDEGEHEGSELIVVAPRHAIRSDGVWQSLELQEAAVFEGKPLPGGQFSHRDRRNDFAS
jgi:hypothetical protein